MVVCPYCKKEYGIKDITREISVDGTIYFYSCPHCKTLLEIVNVY